jgi:HD-GYP domain-containing protein (c-di-GMP phosphodiesterase class II)
MITLWPVSSGSDAGNTNQRQRDAWQRFITSAHRTSVDRPIFFVSCAVLAAAITYLAILALAGSSIAAALPLVVMTTSAGFIALWGWQRDRTAALAALEKQSRAELHNRRLRRQLVELHRVTDALADPTDVPTMIVQIATGLLEAEKGMLIVPRDSSRAPTTAAADWDVVASVGFTPKDAADESVLALATSALGRDRVARDDHPGVRARNAPETKPSELYSLVALPIYVADEFLGVVVCANRPGGFGDFDDDVLLALGDQAGAVIENGRLQSELRDSYVAVVRMLAETIRVKDPALRTHSDEVSDYVVAVARRLGLDPERRERLRFGSLLHDVGKIAISEQILLKPGPLDDEEWRQVRLHPVIGARLLREVPSVAPLADSVLHHHERWDGSGYPKGLAGEAIPLESRIIAVADAFSAMTADRPYREHMTVEDACAELTRLAGSWFDANVVELFVEEVRRRPPKRTLQPVGAALRGLSIPSPGSAPVPDA